MTHMRYGYEDMAGDWTINLWNKDVHVVDNQVNVDSQDDVLYLQDMGFYVDEPFEELPFEENLPLEVIPSEPVVKKRGRPPIKRATLNI
jgi:hypothetical protein